MPYSAGESVRPKKFKCGNALMAESRCSSDSARDKIFGAMLTAIKEPLERDLTKIPGGGTKTVSVLLFSGILYDYDALYKKSFRP